MKVAYLVNRYPYVSHSFIRREIAGLEACGVAVERFAVRPAGETVVDPADAAEAARTRSLLAGGKGRLIGASVAEFARHPLRWLRAARAAWRMGGAAGARCKHLAYLAEACLLVRWLQACGAEHLHAHFGTNPAAVARLTRLLGGPPYSFTVHGPEEFDRPDALSLRDKVADAAFVCAVSSFGRSQLYRWAREVDWPKVKVVRCGVDTAFLKAGPLPVADAPRLVCVGRLCEQKGQLLLVEAAARLAADGVAFELVLAGDGAMRPQVEAALQEYELGDRVRITGWLSNDAVRDELAAARVMVLPSFAEGLPVVLMEALALGRPVVTTYVAGIPELVEHGVNGWLVPAGDPAALAGALAEALAAPPDKLAAMGQAGSAAVRRSHDAAREAGTLARLFAAIAVPTGEAVPRREPAAVGGVP